MIAAHGCYAMTATTALTAQNTLGVSDIHHVPSSFVVKQIDACLDDIGVDVVKVGMLASASTVDAVADALKKHGRPTTVVDPVMVATSGAQLLPNEAVYNLRVSLLPLTTILTPNIPEARLLLENAGLEAPQTNSLDDIVNIARVVQSLGPRYVLVKGGHLPLTKDGHVSKEEADRQTIVDVLYDGRDATIYKTDYLPSKNTHGTGCSLACKVSPKAFSPLHCWFIIAFTQSFLDSIRLAPLLFTVTWEEPPFLRCSIRLLVAALFECSGNDSISRLDFGKNGLIPRNSGDCLGHRPLQISRPDHRRTGRGRNGRPLCRSGHPDEFQSRAWIRADQSFSLAEHEAAATLSV